MDKIQDCITITDQAKMYNIIILIMIINYIVYSIVMEFLTEYFDGMY